MAFNLYFAMNPGERVMFEETLMDIIENLNGGFPLKKTPQDYERIDNTKLFRKRKRDHMALDTYNRKRVLRHFELLGLLEPRRFGRFVFFKPLSYFEKLKRFIDDHSNMLRGKYDSASYLELDDNPDEEKAALYENSVAKYGKRIRIKAFYRNHKPYLLLRFLLDHEHEKRDFEQKELFAAVRVKSKDERKLREWIKALKIDEGSRRGKYIKFVDDKIHFRSSLVERLHLLESISSELSANRQTPQI